MAKTIVWQDAIYENESDWEDLYNEEVSEGAQYSLSEFIEENISDSHDSMYEMLEHSTHIPEGVICVARLGLWNGKRLAFDKNEYHDLSACLEHRFGGYLKVYIEDGEVKAEEAHHDGTNEMVFRKWKPNVSEEDKERVKDAFYYNQPNAFALLDEHTNMLGEDLKEVIG